MQVSMYGMEITIPTEDEICSQNFLSIVEGEPQPGQHQFGCLTMDSKNLYREVGIICCLCGKSWMRKA